MKAPEKIIIDHDGDIIINTDAFNLGSDIAYIRSDIVEKMLAEQREKQNEIDNLAAPILKILLDSDKLESDIKLNIVRWFTARVEKSDESK